MDLNGETTIKWTISIAFMYNIVMQNIEEKISRLMQKESKAKTILIEKENLDKVIEEQAKEGFKLIKKSEINGKIKVTFVK